MTTTRMILAALALALGSAAAHAQYYNGYGYQTPSFGSYSGTYNGQPLYGSSSTIGPNTYSGFNSGGRQTNCTTTRLGTQVYTSCY